MNRIAKLGVFLGGVACAACGPSNGPVASPKPAEVARAAPKPEPGTEKTASLGNEGLALFDRLVGMARRYHVFAPQTERNLGRRWDDDLPTLRSEFERATTNEALQVALWHFGNSLHDIHCQFRPPNRGDRVRLGFRVGVERMAAKEDGYRFYMERVNDPALANELRPGDVLVEFDGVSANDLLHEYAFATNMNSRDNVASEVAQYLTSRRTSTTPLRGGATATLKVVARGGGEPRSITVPWKQTSPTDDGDFALDYGTSDCVNADPKNYGPYTMTVRGYRACIYMSTAPGYRDYPIVRHTSFRYDEVPHGPLVDFELIRSTLSRLKPKGVLLDVQDNGGGINPNLFIEWWTDKPYVDTSTRMILDDDLLRDEHGASHISSLNSAIREWYSSELAHRVPGSSGPRISSPRPFMCKDETCSWDNHYAPKHRVTSAPVALLLGPLCASSCDALAWHFDKDDIGPIVGRPSMAGFTTHRARFDVALHDGAPALGTIDFAVSYDTAPGSTESIEGVPVHVDVPVPRTFENHAHYDAALVDAAVKALRSR